MVSDGVPRAGVRGVLRPAPDSLIVGKRPIGAAERGTTWPRASRDSSRGPGRLAEGPSPKEQPVRAEMYETGVRPDATASYFELNPDPPPRTSRGLGWDGIIVEREHFFPFDN